jgi:hypothetical protein
VLSVLACAVGGLGGLVPGGVTGAVTGMLETFMDEILCTYRPTVPVRKQRLHESNR